MNTYRIVLLERKDWYPRRTYYYTMVSGIEPDKVSVIWGNNMHTGIGQTTYSLSKMDSIIKNKQAEKDYSIIKDMILSQGTPISLSGIPGFDNAVFCFIRVPDSRYPALRVWASTEHDYVDQYTPQEPMYRTFALSDVVSHKDNPDFTIFSDQIRFPVLHELCDKVRNADLSMIMNKEYQAF